MRVQHDRKTLVDAELSRRLVPLDKPFRQRAVHEGRIVVEALQLGQQFRVRQARQVRQVRSAGEDFFRCFHVERTAEALVGRKLCENN